MLPNIPEPKTHLLACIKWPRIHPNSSTFGKPIELFYTGSYEELYVNRFVLASSIATRAIVGIEKLSGTGQHVRVAIPLVE